MIKVLEGIVYWMSSFSTGADVDAICALESVVGLDVKNEDDEDFVIAQKRFEYRVLNGVLRGVGGRQRHRDDKIGGGESQ